VRRTVVLAVATAALVAFGIGLALRPVTHRASRHLVVDEVRAQLASLYYRNLPKQVLGKPTVPALLGALHDRYTTYLSPSEFRVARRTYVGGYGGIGLFVLPAPGGLLVRRTMVGPARVAGVRPGDTIMAVDGSSTAALPFHEAMGRILGRPGSKVTLRILRDGRPMQLLARRGRVGDPAGRARRRWERERFGSCGRCSEGPRSRVDHRRTDLREVARPGDRAAALRCRAEADRGALPDACWRRHLTQRRAA